MIKEKVKDNNMIKIISYISVLVSSVSPGFFSLDLGPFQLSLFRAIIMVVILFMFCQGFKENRIVLNLKKETRYSRQFYAIWLIYAILSLGWVNDYESWIRAVYFIALGFICITIYSSLFRTSKDVLVAFRLTAILIIIHNIIGWYEIYTGNYIFLDTDRILLYARNSYPVSMFHNTNNFATYMLFSVFISYICAVNARRIIGKLTLVITMVSSFVLVIMTKSRANILGLIIASAVFIYLSMKNKWGKGKIILVIMTLFVEILLVAASIESMSQMINPSLSRLYFSDLESNFIRLNLIKNGLHFLVSTFGFGTGAGNVEYWMKNYAIYHTGGILNMHNWWMEILTGYGVIIFILYIIFYSQLFRSLYKTYKLSRNRNRIDCSISLGIICCMTGFILGSISSSSNIFCEWLWAFWGIVIAFQGNLSSPRYIQKR